MQQQTVSINSELSKFAYCEYLKSLEVSELVHWLIHSFSPERYRNSHDVVEFACRLIFFKSNQPELIRELFIRIWAMHRLEPDPAPYFKTAEILPFKRSV